MAPKIKAYTVFLLGLVLCAEASVPATPILTMQQKGLVDLAQDAGDRGLHVVEQAMDTPFLKDKAVRGSALLQNLIQGNDKLISDRIRFMANSNVVVGTLTLMLGFAMGGSLSSQGNWQQASLIHGEGVVKAIVGVTMGALVLANGVDLETLAFTMFLALIVLPQAIIAVGTFLGATVVSSTCSRGGGACSIASPSNAKNDDDGELDNDDNEKSDGDEDGEDFKDNDDEDFVEPEETANVLTDIRRRKRPIN